MSNLGQLIRPLTTSVRRPDTWPGFRIRFACFSLAAAAATATVVLSTETGASLGYGVATYLAVATLAVFVPAAITPQVIGGQLLAGALWLQGGDGAAAGALLVLATVIVTAELLSEVARLDSPLHREPKGILARAATAGVMGGLVFGLLAFADGLPSLSGLLGVAIGAAVSGWVALRMVRPRI